MAVSLVTAPPRRPPMTAPPMAFYNPTPKPPPAPKPQASGSYMGWSPPPGYGAGVQAAMQTIPGGPGFNPNIFGSLNLGTGQIGGQPDLSAYMNMIGGDYDVQGMESRMNSTLGRLRGDFTSGIRQALIDLGITDKSKLGNMGSYIDAATIQKAAENKYSQNAQIEQAVNKARAQSEASLAARGMLGSGQLTSDQENAIAQGEQSRYGALRSFLQQGQQGLTNIADVQDQLAGQLADARFAAAQRAAMLAQYQDMMNAWNAANAPAPITPAGGGYGPGSPGFVFGYPGLPPSQRGYNPDPTHPYW